jgi:antitoxin HicB
MEYPIVTSQCEEGGYVVEIPGLKGCLAQGETLDEALAQLKIVTDIWLETAEQYGQQLPEIGG